MKYKLNENNNSKKLIIGVSILFCTVILIIGVTLSYFTQSDSKTTGNIVSVNEVTLSYSDNKEYMKEGLIPSSEEYAKYAYSIEGANKCIDDNGYNICSVYQFTIKNNANITQELVINMTPTLNTFSNLKFMLYEIENGVSNEVLSTQPLTYDDKTTKTLVKDLILNANSSKTYEIVYYILNLEEIDQTSVDANKNFGATISVNSVTTGTYISNQEGASCWKTEPLDDGTNNYKLTEFYGINNDSSDTENYGKVISGCESYVTLDEDKFYSITVPVTYGGNSITTLGNTLFNAVAKDSDGNILGTNNFHNIELITIRDGITVIEDGDVSTYSGTFMGIGVNLSTQRPYADRSLEVILPETLEIIGAEAFTGSALSKLIIPSSVTIIGSRSFNATSNLKSITFSESNGEDINLLSIEGGAFSQSGLTNLTIPSRVNIIGNSAFYENLDLTVLTFDGIDDGSSQLKTIDYHAFEYCNISILEIPYTVTSIGDYAFAYNYNLTKLTFSGSLTEVTEDNLLTIGYDSFFDHDLNYLGTTDEDYLVLPARVNSIGLVAFDGLAEHGNNLKFIKYMGTREKLDSFGTSWYKADNATVIAIDD